MSENNPPDRTQLAEPMKLGDILSQLIEPPTKAAFFMPKDES